LELASDWCAVGFTHVCDGRVEALLVRDCCAVQILTEG
jgi:hypothetical protein